MPTLRFKTNLNCGRCVAAVTPLLDAERGIHHWRVDTSTPDKTLTVAGDAISADRVRALVAQAGFRVLEEVPEPAAAAQLAPAGAAEPAPSFYPLGLILAYLLGAVVLRQLASGPVDTMQAMSEFMAGFFLVFSFFKLLDLRAFAQAYSGYDVVAQRWPGYGLVYPFLELGLGLAYLTGFQPLWTNVATMVLMGVGSIGVVRSLASRRRIRCACLGAVFNLPMTYVTLVEDLLMVVMALAMLLAGSGSAGRLG